MKRFLSAAAAAALALSLNTAALAAGGYAGSITINGTALDTSGLPAASAPYTAVPLRSVAESDYGYAAWYPEEGRSFFSLDGNSIYVDCATGAIELNGEAQTGMTASFTQGVTFVPVELFNHLEGYTATVQDSRIAIVTPNGEALTKLARQIIAKIELGASNKPAESELKEYYGLDTSRFDEVAAFFPMMISADTIVIGKVKSGEMDAVKKELEAVRARTQQSFEQYLPEPLERAKNGRVVTSGDYVMLIISGDNDTAIQMFRDGVKG